uniref:Uncharacterized protein n=1 Tax=Romanomermis culicivorax TaxID=13658 RepID=A0A915IMQ7_ROMCU
MEASSKMILQNFASEVPILVLSRKCLIWQLTVIGTVDCVTTWRPSLLDALYFTLAPMRW